MADAKRLLILLAESNPDVALVLLTRLEVSGYEVVIVTEGNKVMSTFRARLPSLVLLDVSLPVVDGFTILHAIKDNEDSRVCNVPVIMMGYREKRPQLVDDYIIKPFRTDELLRMIEKLLKSQR